MEEVSPRKVVMNLGPHWQAIKSSCSSLSCFCGNTKLFPLDIVHSLLKCI